jgi:predicted nucleic acid-binding protein
VGAIDHYFDTSFLVALLIAEPSSDRADRFAKEHPSSLIVSDFAAAEFASAMARRVRTKATTIDEARADLSDFDAWALRSTFRTEISPADVAVAESFLRRLDLTLRTPDAIHIALARRVGATLVTFDERMKANAQTLGIAPADV